MQEATRVVIQMAGACYDAISTGTLRKIGYKIGLLGLGALLLAKFIVGCAIWEAEEMLL